METLKSLSAWVSLYWNQKTMASVVNKKRLGLFTSSRKQPTTLKENKTANTYTTENTHKVAT